MKFTKYTFLMLGLASSLTFDAYADNGYCNSQGSKAPTGEYCKATRRWDCEKGCYCKGGGNFTWAVGDVEKGCENRWSKVTSELNSKGVYLCPSDYPKSDKKAKSEQDCYYLNSNKKIYYKTHTCSSGQYLPKNSDTCANCTSGKYCPGVYNVYPSKSSDQGINTCPTGQVPNSSASGCYTPSPTITCSSGQYKDGSTCKNCPEGFPKSTTGAFQKEHCYYVSPHGNGNVFYKTVSCPAGEYLPRDKGTCVKCSQSVYCLDCSYASPNARGYICTGTNGTVTPKDVDQGVKKCEGDSKPDSMQMSCVSDKKSCSPGFYLPGMSITNGGVTVALNMPCTPCPNDGHTICPGGGPWKNETYDQGKETCSDSEIPNSTRTSCQWNPNFRLNCKPGEYVPKNTDWCVSCDNLEYGDHSMYVCPGGELFLSAAQDVGLTEKCEAPSRPDHIAGKCVRDNITCIPGTYLPANSPLGTECSPCPNGKLCLGGTFEIMRSIDQGADGKCQGDTIINSSGKECVACEFGKKPNSTHTACVSTGSTTVNPGYFLPKGSTESKKCTSTSKYCPGGTFDPSTSRDQGQFDCPTGSRATDDKSACAVTLTKKQMMYGINGTGGRYSENAVQCWTKTGADYKACMGFKSDGSLVSTSVPGLSINLKPIKVEMKPIKAELKLGSPLVQAASKDLVTKESPRKD